MKLGMYLVLFIALMAMMMSTVLAQSSCTNFIISMAPCLAYITQNTSSPSQQCCNRLANVVRSSSECLCQVLEGGDSQLAINVNQTQALALPKACHVQTPPVSRCNEHGINGTKTVRGDKSSSHGSYIKFSFTLLVILSIASYITNFAKY